MDEKDQPHSGDEPLEARAERVLAALDKEDGEGPDAPAEDAPRPEGEDSAALATPPVSWSKEEKAAFARLSPEAQAAIARREADRERLLTSRTQELARLQRELGDDRQRLGRELDALIGQAAGDPVMIEGSRLDWARLRQEDPAAYARKWPIYQQRAETLAAAQRSREALARETARSLAQREAELLAAKAPEFADPTQRRALVEALDGFLRQEGFSREQIGQIHDHRAVLILRDAMRWRQQETARKSLAAKKVAAAPRTERPGAASEGGVRSERVAALRKRAAATGKLDDRAAYVLAALETDE